MQTSRQTSRLMAYLFWILISTVSILVLIELAPKQNNWPYLDKIEHILVFSTLGTLGYFAYPHKKMWIYSGLAAYGLTLEWLQATFTLTRTASVYDWVADIVGLLLSIAAVHFLKKYFAT